MPGTPHQTGPQRLLALLPGLKIHEGYWLRLPPRQKAAPAPAISEIIYENHSNFRNGRGYSGPGWHRERAIVLSVARALPRLAPDVQYVVSTVSGGRESLQKIEKEEARALRCNGKPAQIPKVQSRKSFFSFPHQSDRVVLPTIMNQFADNGLRRRDSGIFNKASEILTPSVESGFKVLRSLKYVSCSR